MIGRKPVFYDPAYGPSMDFTAIYQQLDALPARPSQTAIDGFSHLGPGWSCEWLSYVIDTPATNDPVKLIWQGFRQSFSGYNAATQSYAPHRDERTVLKELAEGSYQLSLPDGSRRIYSHPDGASANRRVHLTQIIDPQDRAVTLTYDAWHRLTRVTDATGGRWFDLLYENA